MKPIAHIYTDFKTKFGLPRQSGLVKEITGKIVFEKEYSVAEAFKGLEDFSHIWILWEFSEAKNGYSSALSKIKPSDILPLEKFLEERRERELLKRKESYLKCRGYSLEILSQDYKPRDKDERRARRRAMRIKQHAIRTGMLLERDNANGKIDLYHPTARKLFRIAMKLIPTSACMVFTASVMLNAKGELTAGVMIESLLRLSTLPIVGFRGYAFGYRYTKNTRASQVREKTRILEAYLAQAPCA